MRVFRFVCACITASTSSGTTSKSGTALHFRSDLLEEDFGGKPLTATAAAAAGELDDTGDVEDDDLSSIAKRSVGLISITAVELSVAGLSM